MSQSSAAESVEARILEIARAHVRKFGAARATVVGVAQEAGMTHANVYRYFPSKTALLEEVTASWLRPIETRLREAAEGADSRLRQARKHADDGSSRLSRRNWRATRRLFDLLIEALEEGRGSARRHRARVHRKSSASSRRASPRAPSP